jgi:hypothetical protein
MTLSYITCPKCGLELTIHCIGQPSKANIPNICGCAYGDDDPDDDGLRVGPASALWPMTLAAARQEGRD